MSEQSNAVAVIPEDERQLRGLELAERHFPMERREQIAQFLDVPANSPALLPYLAWCAGLNLSPISGHVWLIPKKIKGHAAKDGEPAVPDRVIYRPAIGRDGLLHKARETKGHPGGYRGMKFGVVCEHDTFEVEEDGSLDGPKVLHRFASKPTEFPAGVAPDRYRGRIIGAWAKAFVDGEPPTFYFANLREHGRLRHVWDYNPEARQRKPLYLDEQGKPTFREFGEGGVRLRPVQEWEGAWDYTSTMVLKAAQSYVLRIALGVTGVVPVDELRDVEAWKRGDGGDELGITQEAPPDFDFETLGVSEETTERLRLAVETANSQDPYSWGPAKCEMVLSGRTEEELLAIIEQIESENDLREQRLAGEVVTDAEVVEEPAEKADKSPEGEEPDPERIEMLRHRLADLQATMDDVTDDDAKAQLGAEMDQVEAELKSLGVDPSA